MHFNELALVPAHRNSFHEFTHCEVAVFAAPKAKIAMVILEDKQDDQYTKNKIKNLAKALTAKVKENKNTVATTEIKACGLIPLGVGMKQEKRKLQESEMILV